MKRSIRWTLLGWYALILLVVIGGLGTALYLRQRASDFGRIEAELRTHALAVSNAIEWDIPEGFEFEFRNEYRAQFEQTGEDAPYLLIWGPNGDELFRSRAAPAYARPLDPGSSPSTHRRELTRNGPEGTTIRVGRGTAGLERTLGEFGRSLVLAGVVALAVALAGGWLLVRRVLRPIDRITETASRISASNLSERIDVGRTESELGVLAGTLNDAFDRLEVAVERQAQFTADASHELRTPLAVIVASTEWALRRERSPRDQVEALAACRRASQRMARTVRDLLALARADAGADAPSRAPVDLADVARDAAALLEPLARESGVTLTVRPIPTTIEGERKRLDVAVLALLSNAILHHREGGHVNLETGEAEGTAWVRISDDGPGIPAEHLPRIFERFYRVDAGRSGRAGGSGLGLAIVKEIAEAHGGEVAAESEAGSGSCFVIRLPATAIA